MTNDNIIVTSLDQPLALDADKFLQTIRGHLEEAVDNKDAGRAFGIIKQLRLASQLSGLSLAQALWIIKDSWDEFEISGEFEEVAYERIGLHKATVREYCRVWDLFQKGYIPAHLQANFKSKNIKDLKYIANTVSRGFNIREDEWEELADAPDYSTVSRKIRDIKGVEPRQGSLQIYLDKEGTLTAFYNDRIEYVGYLDIHSDEEIVEKSINRLISNSGVIEK